MVDVTRTTLVSDYWTAAEAPEEGFDSTISKILGDDAFYFMDDMDKRMVRLCCFESSRL